MESPLFAHLINATALDVPKHLKNVLTELSVISDFRVPCIRIKLVLGFVQSSQCVKYFCAGKVILAYSCYISTILLMRGEMNMEYEKKKALKMI